MNLKYLAALVENIFCFEKSSMRQHFIGMRRHMPKIYRSILHLIKILIRQSIATSLIVRTVRQLYVIKLVIFT